MALNELLIISIQTRLKGSLLIGHRKQELLLMLHSCPLLEVHSKGVLGSDPVWDGVAPPGVCVPLQSLGPHLGLCAHAGLCVPVQGYAY